jgi:hypothetical protein
MANGWYGKALETAVETGLGWAADSILAFLQCSEHYTPDLAADDQLADVVSGGAVTATSGALADKTNALGVLNATDKVFTAVADNGHYIDYVGLYNDTDAGDPLLMLWDNGTGLPVYANGVDITVTWGNVAGTLLAKI